MEKIPFSPPRIDEAIIQEVANTLRSGWITTGPRTKQLEKEVAQLSKVPRVLCVNSATAGMELILRWFGVQEGDEVIVPAYTYCATANVVIHCGATPVMVDVRSDDGTIDVDRVAEAITPRTKAIIPVDLAGMPADYERLMELVKSSGPFQPQTSEQEQLGRILVMADAAHSLGASYKNQAAASFPDVSVFSFHAVKNLTTAEGGAICLNLPSAFDLDDLYKKLNTKSLHGQSKDALAKFGKNSWEYDVYEAGYKCNMPDVLAAIGLVEVRRYAQDTLPKRKAILDAYHKGFLDIPWAQTPLTSSPEKESSAHLYLLRIRQCTLEQRNAIIQRIFDQGVSVNVHYKPLPLLQFYKQLGYNMADYPVSCDFFHRVITLPVFYDLTDDQQQRVVQVVKEAVEQELGTASVLPLFKTPGK